MATSPHAPAPPASSIARRDYSSSLHRRFLVGTSLVGVLAILLLGGAAYALLGRNSLQRGDETLREVAHRSALVLGDALQERIRETAVMAMSPEVIAAAREGNTRALALGLAARPIDSLEKQFATEHSMLLAPSTRLLLRSILPRLDARDLLLTNSNGYNALITDRSADFVQSDEEWWQNAWRTGQSVSDAAFDTASRSSVIAVSSTIRGGTERVGVLKVKFDVTPLVASLASAGAGVRVDVVDSSGRILLSSDSTAMGGALPRFAANDSMGAMDVRIGSSTERAVVRTALAERWLVVTHQPYAAIDARDRTARQAIVLATLGLLMVLALLLYAVHRFLTRRMTAPVIALARAAESVAAGNFAVEVAHTSSDDEIGRLGRAVGAMVLELRRLAQAIASSSYETTTMSSEITAGSEEMAATAGEIANTASDLAAQSTQMAESIASLAGSAGSLRSLASELETGANEGVTRNVALRVLAMENRAGLDASALSLGTLGDDVNASAMAIEALAEASTEIRLFVTLVRKLARQSKLLALNAAMEAARAGEQGEGFAVVAGEVRRLAAMSSDAAERTEAVVNGVLDRIRESRESAGRAVAMGAEVMASTSRASASFAEIERAVQEADVWTSTVQRTSAATSELVADMTLRLDALAGNTESFAAAMEQVAASSQEQSAATEEIAAAANTLVTAADRLRRLVGELTLGETVADVVSERDAPPTSGRYAPVMVQLATG
jgi:methyl-accepting chemotaxis protein